VSKNAFSEGVGGLNNAGTPNKTPNMATPPIDDIPIALRETPQAKSKSSTSPVIIAGTLSAVGVAALAAGILFALRVQQSQSQNSTLAAVNSPAVTTSPSPAASPSDTLLNHFAYSEAPRSELAPIVDDGSLKLRKPAAKAYREMVAAAASDGVSLNAISGFRSISDQQSLYFDVKAERGQVPKERAKVSAPPGYSEHHTGYAIDIGDGDTPATNLSTSFEKTAAFRWLKANAAFYSFEISFPKDNKQGVSYEPWHWRYVGDINSLKTFYKARGQAPVGSEEGKKEPGETTGNSAQ
jgi:D-alanyl-D-alanine carboxypeptidase